jgi:hypothetical protein
MFNRVCLNVLLLAGLTLTISGCTSGDPSLTSITVTPTTMNFGGSGLQTQLTATGSYTHPGHPATLQNITDQVTWASSTPECVTVNQTGLITSGGNVCSNILVTASMPGFPGLISGSMTVNVTQPANPNTDVVSVAVIPATQTVASLNVPIQYEAIGTTSGGLTVALGNFPQQLKWASSTGTVATINATSGLATTTGSGTTTITATFTNADSTGAIGTATLTVAPTGSPEPLTAITVAPTAQTATVVGQQAQFLAIATTGSGTSVNLTDQSAVVNGKTIPAAVWTSSNPSVATIDPASGLATAVSAGAAVITAIATNPDSSVVTGTATYTVTVAGSSSGEPLTALTIQPNAQSVAGAGQTSQFLAIGTFAANSTTPGTQNMANIPGYTMAWYSSNPSVATINSAGVATATGQGVTAITAIATNNTDHSAAYATATFTVTGPSTQQVTALAIIPGSQAVTLPAVGSAPLTANFIAIGTSGSTGLQENVTGPGAGVTWSSSNPAVATVNSSGIATAISQGSTTITAQYTNPATSSTPANVVTATATLTVNGVASEPLLSVAILPATQSVAAPNQTSQLVAIGTFSAVPTTQDVTKGLANPAITTKWISSDTAVATVGSPEKAGTTPGLVTGVGQGTAAIEAISSNPDGTLVTSTATFTVIGGTTEQITALQIIPSSQAATAPAQTNQFVALGTQGSTGLQFDLTSQVVWNTATPTVATICTAVAEVVPVAVPVSCPSTPGLITALANGATAVTATYTNPDNSQVVAQGNYTVTIGPAPEPLISITIVPTSISVGQLQDTGQFLAFGTFSTVPTYEDITNGIFHQGFAGCPKNSPPSACTTPAPLNWISTAPDVFPINTTGIPGDPAGVVTAFGIGTDVIVAEAQNPDGTEVTALSTFSCPLGNCFAPVSAQLATLTVYNAGANSTTWLVTAPSNTGQANLIHCGPGSEAAGLGAPVCEANYPVGSTVTLTESPTGSSFGGWSANCETAVDVPNTTATCPVSLTTNETVGAIFN